MLAENNWKRIQCRSSVYDKKITLLPVAETRNIDKLIHSQRQRFKRCGEGEGTEITYRTIKLDSKLLPLRSQMPTCKPRLHTRAHKHTQVHTNINTHTYARTYNQTQTLQL